MLAKFSVKKPLTVLVAVILVLILGFVSFTSMTPDLLPNMDFPMAVLMTTYPGASSEEVETTVTKPLEQSMATLENINAVTSSSGENYSILFLEFNDSVNMDAISVDIREKISLIEGAWPESVGTPYLMKINPNILPVMIAAVDLDGADVTELTSFLNDTLINKLEGVAGVASISTSGAIEKQINVLLSQEKIDAVNEKMQAALADQFDKADAELADAKAELERQAGTAKRPRDAAGRDGQGRGRNLFRQSPAGCGGCSHFRRIGTSGRAAAGTQKPKQKNGSADCYARPVGGCPGSF